MTPFEVIGLVADLLGIAALAWAFLKKTFSYSHFKKNVFYVDVDGALLLKKT